MPPPSRPVRPRRVFVYCFGWMTDVGCGVTNASTELFCEILSRRIPGKQIWRMLEDDTMVAGRCYVLLRRCLFHPRGAGALLSSLFVVWLVVWITIYRSFAHPKQFLAIISPLSSTRG